MAATSIDPVEQRIHEIADPLREMRNEIDSKINELDDERDAELERLREERNNVVASFKTRRNGLREKQMRIDRTLNALSPQKRAIKGAKPKKEWNPTRKTIDKVKNCILAHPEGIITHEISKETGIYDKGVRRAVEILRAEDVVRNGGRDTTNRGRPVIWKPMTTKEKADAVAEAA